MRQGLIGGGLAIVAMVTFHTMTGQAQGPLATLLSVVLSVIALLFFIAAAALPAPVVKKQGSSAVRAALGLCVLALLLGFLIFVVVASRFDDNQPAAEIARHRPALEPRILPPPPPPLWQPAPGQPAAPAAVPPPAVAQALPKPLGKPAYTAPAGQPGEPTELVGGPEGWQFQSVDNDRRPILGFRYAMGSWADQPAVAEFTPLYERDAPAGGASLEYGREGYVVGELQIAAGDLVNAVRVVYVRQQPDGQLNKSDSYVSNWIGDPGNRPIRTVGDRQARPIGICGRHGAVKNSLALVLERQPPAATAAATSDAVDPKPIASNQQRLANKSKRAAHSAPVDPSVPVYKPPPTLPGRPTELAGGPKGWQFELFDKNRRPVVGFRYRMGSWSGEPAVAQLEPLYDRQPAGRAGSTTIAREDYVVGGVHVVSGELVNAVRIIFVRQQTDGSLDKSDFYLSDWIGDPGDRKPTVLGDGKTKVIGVCGRHGAVLNALALVLDEG